MCWSKAAVLHAGSPSDSRFHFLPEEKRRKPVGPEECEGSSGGASKTKGLHRYEDSDCETMTSTRHLCTILKWPVRNHEPCSSLKRRYRVIYMLWWLLKRRICSASSGWLRPWQSDGGWGGSIHHACTSKKIIGVKPADKHVLAF